MNKSSIRPIALVFGVVLALAGTVPAALAQDNCQPPRVLIVLDKSSSMVTGNDSNGVTKWDSATAAVETLVNAYGDRIDFGLMLFPLPDECNPGQVLVDVGPGTAPAIVSVLRDAPPESGNYTPMAESLDVAATYAPLLDAGQRTYVLLVTDGWQWCYPYDASTRFDAVGSVETLYSLGVDTFVLGFGSAVDVLNNNRMAVAGGHALDGCNPEQEDPDALDLCYHQTGDQADLEAAFDAIALQVTEEECDGLDNDCDGYVDNAVPGHPDPIKENITKACGTCVATCIDGALTDCEVSGPCDDGNACTDNDWCEDDLCAGSPVGCGDGNPCTDDSCDPASGCVHTPNDLACDDQNPCTDDACDVGAGCTHAANSATCDDGDPCTANDGCAGGSCAGAPFDCENEDLCEHEDCNDENPCTDDTCDSDIGCVHVNNSLACDDGNPCTRGDTCSGGVCHGAPLDCDDGNPCTEDYCGPGGCEHAPLAGPCDDGDPCTENDVCLDGVCVGEGVCEKGDALEDDVKHMVPTGCQCNSTSTGGAFGVFLLLMLGLAAWRSDGQRP